MINESPLTAKFRRAFTLTPDERQALDAIRIRIVAIGANQDLVREGDQPSRCIMVLAGLASTSKIIGDGKRQVTAYHVPGDMPDLLSLHLDLLDSDVRTVSACSVGFIDHSAIRLLCERYPRLAANLWRTTLVDASIFREWVVNVGKRQALGRVAHLLCEIMLRMDDAGLAFDQSCAFAVTQADLGEATGLSAVHINRTLKALREKQLSSLVNGQLTIHDWEGLAILAEFRHDYLHSARTKRRVEPLSMH
ncbi:Crp/Fnr family transcriptional regulator [Mesorhizobium sp. B292B1B]|uniref:Crp/Fnr family transcriptional regulator n=1 Tax=unclassified Mesorhizobium TaxID=325217 RepID=UPI0011288818|nr:MULTISPECIES: Crp/Fnr family transcriptional regulator [unclassified Mesorhizobium]MBZ9921039.1 Crp/Fnr family transcriptional regulator [Mesorhizobium sp. BR1-1-7]MCA0011804.1 Crp/Fnr family transcriptional regulator [Mesorhizobium sp. B294B1A1]MCA0038059.1 Crp/Fnr family transcriptional regulator [Mesorhizobium sp. B292B1B]TPM42612.1 Crp/Fnr family transcriptional regulator [Mesorhizobium sp. B2-3-2]